MLTPAWTQLRPHVTQSALWRSSAKFRIVVAGRGSGKSELAKRYCVRWLNVERPRSNPMYFYALPTWKQAKRVAWKDLKALVPPEWLDGQPSESDLIIKTVFGSELHLLGLDKPMRAEGVQWDGGVIDESSDQRPGVFDLSILPALSHHCAWCWRIGVPKRFGVGAREFKREFERALECKDGSMAAFTWPSEDVVPADVIEWAKEHLDPVDYNEQYGAAWESAGGRIFHAFDPRETVTEDADYMGPDYPIIVGQDFNVDPMAWTLSQRGASGQLYTFDEIWLRHTNTEAAMDYLWKRWGKKHPSGWTFVGDASGRARKTSATRSDYIIVKSDERFLNKRVHYPRANPGLTDRFATCNAVLRNAKGKRRAFIHPRCVHLVRDLEDRAYREGTREPDDHGDVGHVSDAWGYPIVVLYPLGGQPQGSLEIFAGT